MTDLERARKEDPGGGTCAGCGQENTFADDIGFFYMDDKDGNYRAHCQTCIGPLTGDR